MVDNPRGKLAKYDVSTYIDVATDDVSQIDFIESISSLAMTFSKHTNFLQSSS